MLFNRFWHSKIVNILKDFTNASLQNMKYFSYPIFKLLNILGFIRNGKTKQIKEIAEIHVMCDMT